MLNKRQRADIIARAADLSIECKTFYEAKARLFDYVRGYCIMHADQHTFDEIYDAVQKALNLAYEARNDYYEQEMY